MAQYNATSEFDVHKARSRLEYLIEKQKTFEIIEKKPKRSLNQNNYLHLILSYFGLEFGYSLEEVKQEIFKKEVNSTLFYQGEKEGVVKIQRWRSTSDLKTDEMTLAIERFRNFSSGLGCYLPEPKDIVLINQMESELGKYNNKIHL